MTNDPDLSETTISSPQCACGNASAFILREIHRTTGYFHVEKGRLIFKPQRDSANLDRDAVVCDECCEEVITEDFDVAD